MLSLITWPTRHLLWSMRLGRESDLPDLTTFFSEDNAIGCHDRCLLIWDQNAADTIRQVAREGPCSSTLRLPKYAALRRLELPRSC